MSAFGWVTSQRLWVFCEYAFAGLDIAIVPDAEANPFIAAMTDGALVVEWTPEKVGEPASVWHPVNVCTTQIAAIIGLKSGALRGSSFLKDLIRHGGRIVADGTPERAPQGTERAARGAAGNG